MKRGIVRGVLLLAAMLFSGCTKLPEKLSLNSFSLTPLGSSGFTLHTCIDNASRRTLRLTEGELALYLDRELVLRAELRGEVSVAKRSHSERKSRWKLLESNPTLMRQAEAAFEQGDTESLAADYRLCIRSGALKKTFSGQMVPLSDFLRTLHRE